MNCDQIRDRLVDYPDHIIDPAEKQSIEDHLAVCPNCREEQEALTSAYAQVRQTLATAVTGASPSPQLWASIERRLSKKRGERFPVLHAIKSDLAGWAKGFWKRPLWQRAVSVAILAIIVAVTMVVIEPVASISPGSVIARASAAAAEVNSYHITQTSSYNNKDWVMRNEIDYVLPDRMQCVQYYDNVKNNETIFIGADRYSWFQETGQWTLGSQNFRFESIVERSDTLMQWGAISEIEVLPDEVINGVDCMHYKTSFNPSDPVFYLKMLRETVKLETNPEMLEFYQQEIERTEQQIAEGAEVPDETVVMNYWIGKDDYLIRQFHSIYSRQWQGELEIHTETGAYSQFNEPIEIVAPDI